MKSRKLGVGVGLGHRTLRVETLERRAMLAGNVDVFVSGGTLFIRGDNSDNAVLVSQVGDHEYAVTGFDFADGNLNGYQSGPTKIKGDPNGTVTFGGVTKDIVIDLKKGNDGLAVGNDVNQLAALAEECLGIGFGLGSGSGSGSGDGSGSGSGSGNGSVAPAIVSQGDRFVAPRNLIINTGDGNDNVVVNADAVRSITVDTGKGNDGVAVGNLPLDSEPDDEISTEQVEGDDLNIGDDLIILTGAGNDIACAKFVTVNDYLNIQVGDGNNDVTAEEFDAGHVLVTAGKGNDTVLLSTFDTDREIVVNTAGGNDTVAIEDFSAGQGFGPHGKSTKAGYVTVVTGNGNDNVFLGFFEADGVTVDTGSGNDGTSRSTEELSRVASLQAPMFGPVSVVEASITHQLTLVTGSGNDVAEVEGVTAHDIVVDLGAGNDDGELYNLNVAGNMTVVGGAGNDDLYLHSGGGQTSQVGKNLVVDSGSNNDFVEIVDFLVGNNLNMILGAGNDSGVLGFSDGMGAGLSEGSSSVGGNLLVDAGAGNDSVTVGDVNVHKNANVFLGAGNDSLTVTSVNVTGNALIDAGANNDSVSIQDSSVGGTATILMGAGNDDLTINSSTTGKLLARGGSGKDSFTNDLGIDSNIKTSLVDVKEFESFTTED